MEAQSLGGGLDGPASLRKRHRVQRAGQAWPQGRGTRLPQARGRAGRAGVGWCGGGGCDAPGGRCGFRAGRFSPVCLPCVGSAGLCGYAGRVRLCGRGGMVGRLPGGGDWGPSVCGVCVVCEVVTSCLLRGAESFVLGVVLPPVHTRVEAGLCELEAVLPAAAGCVVGGACGRGARKLRCRRRMGRCCFEDLRALWLWGLVWCSVVELGLR